MRIIKQVCTYLAWTALAILISFGYVSLLIGRVPDEETFGGFWFIARVFYGYGLVYVGSVIGSIVALVFIIIDLFYLKKRLKNKPRRTSIRLLIILVITLFVAIVHYILEKVIDVI